MIKGLSLSDYPRPNVAVDIAVLTVASGPDSAVGGELSVLVQWRCVEPRGAVLPGRFVRPGKTVEQTVGEVLASKLGLDADAIAPELLRVFSEPGRDERGWTISLAHSVTLPESALAGAGADLVPLTGDGALVSGDRLLFDHDGILAEAVAQIRARYEVAPDPDGLLEGPFTLLDLRRLHEAVLGEPLRKDAFNWRMREHLEGLVDERGEPVTGRGVGRPAQLFRRKSRHLEPAQRWQLPRATS